MKIITALLIIFLPFQTNVNAAEINFSEARHINGRYFIKVSGTVLANHQSVFNVLINYNNITKLSPKIIESKILYFEDGEVIVRTVAEGCVWFFCKEIINTQSINTSNTTINSTTIASQSNLKFGKMKWEIKEIDGGTQINYSAEIEPDFFVPPIIGDFFIKKSLLGEAINFIKNVEKVTNEQ